MELKKLADLTRADLRGRLSPATLRRRLQRGEIPYRIIAGKIYLEKDVLEEILEGRPVPTREHVVVGTNAS